MVMVGGVVYGGYSLRAIRADLPVNERPEFDSYMGVSRYAPEDAELPSAADGGDG